ncbi:cold shock domain-containing protein CG9705-like [Diaphorina citri]|uniref:Cold shock domain-containing protein CG9705-like n=1 Tax=Diaphorina citri TaxID=121845 RepID=A0A1S3CXT5_DIACI|nr:cold shock domain-containing protein CG9705-like [Diaphorina citri]KAI5697179.1 hypothetical protein M8J75_006287 [Diaphorina citri]KAI5718864.1 hypothetical protein M8J76_001444 [Diaphorina citri]KAI5720528.1 hypothetical protein M8J77_008242 [Diaphorina citri]
MSGSPLPFENKKPALSSPMLSPQEPHLHSNNTLSLPSPIITRRTRTESISNRALQNPVETGKIKEFCRSKGHGFITPDSGEPAVFVHISDIEGCYVPLPGDEVKYRLCPIPPKFEKNQAVHVEIVHLTPEVHLQWDSPSP